MLLTPQKLLIYPLMISNQVFRLWFSNNRSLKKTFESEKNIDGVGNYYFNCSIKSRHIYDCIGLDLNDMPLDVITNELFLEYEGELFHERFVNYRFINDNKFNYYSLINPLFSSEFFIQYNISKNGLYYNNIEHAETDFKYMKLRDTLHDKL